MYFVEDGGRTVAITGPCRKEEASMFARGRSLRQIRRGRIVQGTNLTFVANHTDWLRRYGGVRSKI